MTYSECCREKLSQSKIQGQSKPFVDKDLQLQLPACDLQQVNLDSFCSSPIYSHYVGSRPSSSYLSLPINETELYQAMTEVETSYEAWKKMQYYLREAIRQSCLNQSSPS